MTNRTPDTEHESFDAWLAARKRPTVRILGHDVVIPSPGTVPAALVWEVDSVDLENEDQVKSTIAQLFGPDELARWLAAGIDLEALAVLLTWGAMRARGETVTFGEAAELYAAMMRGEAPGKAVPNRAEKRAATKATPKKAPARARKRT